MNDREPYVLDVIAIVATIGLLISVFLAYHYLVGYLNKLVEVVR